MVACSPLLYENRSIHSCTYAYQLWSYGMLKMLRLHFVSNYILLLLLACSSRLGEEFNFNTVTTTSNKI